MPISDDILLFYRQIVKQFNDVSNGFTCDAYFGPGRRRMGRAAGRVFELGTK